VVNKKKENERKRGKGQGNNIQEFRNRIEGLTAEENHSPSGTIKFCFTEKKKKML